VTSAGINRSDGGEHPRSKGELRRFETELGTDARPGRVSREAFGVGLDPWILSAWRQVRGMAWPIARSARLAGAFTDSIVMY
jgi:hypothetical protein